MFKLWTPQCVFGRSIVSNTLKNIMCCWTLLRMSNIVHPNNPFLFFYVRENCILIKILIWNIVFILKVLMIIHCTIDIIHHDMEALTKWVRKTSERNKMVIIIGERDVKGFWWQKPLITFICEISERIDSDNEMWVSIYF